MSRALVGMYSGEFERCLKQLNPKLRVCCGETKHAAGLYVLDPMEGYTTICGVDKDFVPVATTVDEVGHILKSGWYRVVRILLNRGYTTPDRVQGIWPNFFLSRVPKAEWQQFDPILNKVQTYASEEEARRGEKGLTADQIMDVAEDIHKKDTEWQRLDRDKAKFNLDKAIGKNQKIYFH